MDDIERPLFRPTASNPINLVIAGKRFRRRFRIRCFAVIDVADAIDHRRQLLAMGQARIGRHGSDDIVMRHTDGFTNEIRRRCVLGVVGTRQSLDPFKRANLLRLISGRVYENGPGCINAVLDRIG